jgi:hypothetical protein
MRAFYVCGATVMQVVEAGESDAASRWLLCCVVSLDMVLMLQELLSGDWVGSFRRPAQPCLQPAKPSRCCQPLPTLWCLFHNNYLIPHTPHTSHFTLHTSHPSHTSPSLTRSYSTGHVTSRAGPCRFWFSSPVPGRLEMAKHASLAGCLCLLP